MNAAVLVMYDHRTTEELFAQSELWDDAASSATRQRLVHRIIRALSIHAAVEELVLYPAVRQAAVGGAAVVERDRDRHRQVKELLLALERTDPDDSAFAATLRALQDRVREHVEEEEESVLPALGSALGPERMEELASALVRARKVAPTDPAMTSGAAARIGHAVAELVQRPRDRGGAGPIDLDPALEREGT